MTDLFDTVTPDSTSSVPGVERDTWGRYMLPDPSRPNDKKKYAWVRATSFAKALSDTYSLSVWNQKMVAKGLALRPDLYALAAATPFGDKSFEGICDQAKTAAGSNDRANQGTAVHAFTEAVDRGEDVKIPERWVGDVEVYKQVISHPDIEIVPEWIERITAVPNWPIETKFRTQGVAGTFDRIVMYRGRPTIADLKTGRDLSYGEKEIAVQLAVYAHGAGIWDPVKQVWEPMPEGLDQATGLVIHLPVGEARAVLYEVDLEWGWNRAQDTYRTLKDGKETKGLFTPVARYAATAEVDKIPPAVKPQAEETNPNDAGHESLNREAAHDNANPPALDGAGNPLTPLAGVGQRGCSVCRRTGHKKGSPKCLGQADPMYGKERTIESVTPRPATPNARANRNAEADESVDPPIELEWCTCSDRSGGWTDPGDGGPWVCGNCRKPSRAGILDGTGRPATAPSDGAKHLYTPGTEEILHGKTPTTQAEFYGDKTVKPSEADIQREMSDGDHDTRASAVAALQQAPEADPFAEEPDPFAPAEPLSWATRISLATSKEEIVAIRAEANEVGEWTKDLIAAGIKRMGQIG